MRTPKQISDQYGLRYNISQDEIKEIQDEAYNQALQDIQSALTEELPSDYWERLNIVVFRLKK